LREIKSPKIPTRAEGLLAELKPTPKIIRELRGWFPKAFLVGWKYELEPAGQAAALGALQIKDSQTNACVLNGRGFSQDGFGLLLREGAITLIPDKPALFAALGSALAAQKPT
jgi:phosphopantothenoylcysteine decarboxylase/phosphopantothenate--cysteine ligase